jgi:hypothetical protein
VSRPAAPESRRRGEAGQALLLALVTLFIAALAAALVAADVGLRERAMRDEALRARLRAMLDGEMATAMGLLAYGQPQPTESRRWAGGGEVRSEREGLSPARYRLRLHASYATLRAAAEAEVVRTPGHVPRVLSFRRLPTERIAR